MNDDISRLLQSHAEEQAQQAASAQQALEQHRQLVGLQGGAIQECLNRVVSPEMHEAKAQLTGYSYHVTVKTDGVQAPDQKLTLMEVELEVWLNERRDIVSTYTLQYRGNAETGTLTASQNLNGAFIQDQPQATATVNRAGVKARLGRFVHDFIECSKAANPIIHPAFAAL